MPPMPPMAMIFAITNIASCAYATSAGASFWMKYRHAQRPCTRLGTVLAQPGGYPHRGHVRRFYPRRGDSGSGGGCTELGRTQVGAGVQENALVHTQGPPLLLRLCIYRDIKKKTGENLGDARHPGRARRPGVKKAAEKLPGDGWAGCAGGCYAGGACRKASRRSTDRGRLTR